MVGGGGTALPNPSDLFLLLHTIMERTRFKKRRRIISLEPGDCIRLITQTSPKNNSKHFGEPNFPPYYLRIEEPMSIVIERKNHLSRGTRVRVREIKKDNNLLLLSKKSQSKVLHNQKIHSSPETIFPKETFDKPPVGSNIPIVSSLFEPFWRYYPKKVSKGQALRAWEKLCNKPKSTRPTWRMIKTAIRRQKESELWTQTPKFIPNPSTWLNQYRWLNDPKEMKAFNSFDKKPFLTDGGRKYRLSPDGRYRNKAGDVYYE